MEVKKLIITAETLAEAQAQLQSKIPNGYGVLTIDVISDGERKIVSATGATVEAALTEARKEIPAQAIILREVVIRSAEVESLPFRITAPEEQRAITWAQKEMERRFGKSFIFKGVKLSKPGSKGILGMGKKSNVYEVEAIRPASINIEWVAKAEIIASLVTIEILVAKLIEDLANSEFSWRLKPEPDESDEVIITEKGKSIRKSAYASLVALGDAAILQLCQALGDSRKPQIPHGPYYVFSGSAAAFMRTGPDTKDGDEVGRSIAEILVQIGNRDLIEQHITALQGSARIRALWVLSRLGDVGANAQLRELSLQNDQEARHYFHSENS